MENRKSVKKLTSKTFSGYKVRIIYISAVMCRTNFSNNAHMYAAVIDSKNNIIGFIDAIYEEYLEIILVCHACAISMDDELLILNNKITVGYHDNVLGSIIDPLGNLVFSFTAKDKFQINRYSEILTEAYNISERGHLNKQFITGYNIIDFLYPIGYGQRMLLIGDKNTYKTSIIINMVTNIISNREMYDRNKKNVCIYVSIGQRKSHLSYVVDSLMSEKIGNLLVISADSSDALGMQFLAPYSAFAIADFYAKNDYNICVFIDDITKHAYAHREINLLAERSPGRERFSSDIFYAHASLLERALKYKNGGSITCIAAVETVEEDIAGFIPTNLISITDGQIVLSNAMINHGIVPPISTSLSVSRTGSAVQVKFYSKLISICKTALSVYYSAIDFYKMYREDCSDLIIEQVRRGMFIINLMYKVNENSIDIIKQYICIIMIIHEIGYNDFSIHDYEEDKFKNFANTLINNVHKQIKNSSEHYDEFINNLDSVDDNKIFKLITREYKDLMSSTKISKQ